MMNVGVMLVVGSGDAPAASDSELVSNAELLNIVDNAAEAADADVVDCTDDAAAVSDDAVTKKTARCSLAIGLSTGHFDAASVKLLRTCSEPDLSRLSRPSTTVTRRPVENSHTGRLIDSNSRDSVHDDLNARVVSQTFSYSLLCRDGRIVIFCRIPDSVNRRLISGRFWIRIRIFDVTLTLVYTNKILHQIASSALYFSNL